MITSTRHPLIRTMRLLAEHSRRDPHRRILLDGPRLIEEALDAGIRVERALVAAGDRAQRIETLVTRLVQAGVRVDTAPPRIVQAAASVMTSQGIVAVAHRPQPPEASRLDAPDLLVLVADGIQDPGNLGTMVRTAVAAGATAVAMTEGTADAFQPKVLRAASGAAFRVPIFQWSGSDLRAALAARDARILVADAHRGLEYVEAPAARPLAIVIGSEAAGPDPAWSETGTFVRIPLFGPVESLNAAVAAGILLYDLVRRQRAGLPGGEVEAAPARHRGNVDR